MKRSIICILAIFLALSLPAQQGGECFYYYRGEKFFLTERTDKIFLKLAADGNKASFLSSIRAGNAVQLSPDLQEGDMLPNFVMLEAKTATGIPLALLEEYRLNSSVISALPLLQYDNRLQGLTDQFIVKLKAGTSDMQFQDLISQYNCSIVKESQFIKRQFIVSVPKTIAFNALQLSNLFYETGWFEFAEPNFVIINAFQSNDPYFEDQWGLKNTGQAGGTAGIDIKAEQAWLTATGAGVKVAVIDDGVDLTHPDLVANLLPGYSAGFDFPNSDTDREGAPISNYDNHGTPCAGVIGAVKDNEEGIAGVAPSCKIIPIHAGDGWNGYPIDYLESSIIWAWQNGADVISNSWSGSSPNDPITNAIDSAVTKGRNGKGCVVVFSAGNNYAATVNYPGRLPNVIAVGANTQNGHRAYFSNHGTALDVVAPGTNVYTTDRQGWYGENKANDGTNGDYFASFNGTSAACPHVSGVAALILSVNPDLTAQQVRYIIESTAQKARPDLYAYQNTADHPNGTWHREMGYGLVNAYAAVQMAQALPCDLMIADSPEDVGIEPNPQASQVFCNSPNIWVRHQNDHGLGHQNPEYNPAVPNYVHVRVKNISSQSSSGTEQLKLYWAKASTSLAWPYHWTGNPFFENGPLCGNQIGTLNIPALPSGGEIIMEFPWLVPNPADYQYINGEPWHFCLLARIEAVNDPMTFPETDDLVDNTKNNNNIAWRNVSMINFGNRDIGAAVAVGNIYEGIHPFHLQFQAPKTETGKLIYREAEVTAQLDDILYKAWERGGMKSNNIKILDKKTILITDEQAMLNNLVFAPNETGTLYLKFNFLTKEFTEKDHYTCYVIQTDGKSEKIIGGEVYEIYKSDRDPFYADAGQDITADKYQAVVLNAQSIGEPAVYNWYDQSGTLISEGADFTTSVTIAQKYRLEVIALADGYKDYAEVNVKLKPNRLETVYPNPVLDQITVEYKLNEAATAYLSIANYYYSHISDNYILDTGAGSGTFNIGSYPAGIYTISLICNGQIADSKIFVKQ